MGALFRVPCSDFPEAELPLAPGPGGGARVLVLRLESGEDCRVDCEVHTVFGMTKCSQNRVLQP